MGRSARWLLGLGLVVGCRNNTIQLEFDTDAATGMSDSMASSDDDAPATSSPTTMMNTTGDDDTPVTTISTTAPSTTGLDVSFFADVAPILQNTCAPACHEPGGEWQTQDLLNSPYFALVGVPSTQLPSMNKVEPGSLETSYLWHKLNGSHIDAGGSGLAMPKGQGTLDAGSLEIIAAWIVDGAPNN